MATTVQVSATTKQLLDQLKDQMRAASFDDLLATMAREKMAIPQSLFGCAKGVGPWTKEDRDDRDL